MDNQAPLSAERQRLLELRLRRAGTPGAASHRIPKRTDGQPAPLSPAQHQMWILDQMLPGNPSCNIPVAYRIAGDLDIRALEESFNLIISRHESWRTTFRECDGDPVQEIHPECRIEIGITDFSHLPAGTCENTARTLAADEAVRPFDLRSLPLVRVAVLRLGMGDHVLLITVHHIIADGLSLKLMFDELDAAYRATLTRTDARLPQLPAQYADFAAWQNHALSTGRHAAQLEYWKRTLHGPLPALELATDKPRPRRQSFSGSTVSFEIPSPLAHSLAAIGAAERCTFFITILAAFQLLLARYSKAAEVIIGTPVASRPLAEFEGIIGNFLNVTALRCDLSGDPSFIGLLHRCKDTALDALTNSEVPFEAVVKALRTDRDPSRNPVFQVLLQVLPPVPARIGELSVSRFDFEVRFAQFDLALHLFEESDGRFLGQFQFCTELFNRETIDRMALNFVHLLNEIVRAPQRNIRGIPIVAAAEKRKLLVEWNAPPIPCADTATVHALFGEQVNRTPDSIAVEFEQQSVTYRELDRRANQIAQHLRSLGAGPRMLLGVCVERSVEMIAAVLGILKTGAAYVPLDPAFPRARLAMMIEDTAMPLIVTQRALIPALPPHSATNVCLDDAALGSSQEDAPQPSAGTPDDLAYVIFTSGSTGRPKGVEIPHRALANFLASMQRSPGIASDDVLLAVTTLSFDIAALEIFLPLISGAKVIVLGRNHAMDANALLGELERRRATIMQATPATWRMLLETAWSGTPRLKALIGGEACSGDLAARLLPKCGELWNMYGPTETTVWSTIAKLSPADSVISVGRPIANTLAYIVERNLQPTPIGVPGELLIGGSGLARGYLRQPDLTAEKFIPDPFSADKAARIYRTGDLARFLPDGSIECLGRIDHQVKLRGFRIELGEIEAALLDSDAVSEAAVIAREDVPGEKRLVAYIVPAQMPQAPADLRSHLRSRLPDYMVPSAFVFLDALPLTANGKVDRKALPLPEMERSNLTGAFVAPRTDLEMRVSLVWKDILKVARVGMQDNFFELGGDSLAAMRVISRLRGPQFPDLNVFQIFERPTVEEFVKSLPVATTDATREEGVL